MWNLILVYLERVLLSVQDSWMVCAKRNIRSEIDLDAPEVLQGDEAQVEAHFVPFRDGANLATR
jgi:high-affinity Fe2+/Pb2+ permease